MVQSVSELFAIVRANPFIDGLGYFVEIETEKPLTDENIAGLTETLKEDFCEHSSASRDGRHVLGLDFHEHIETKGEDAHYFDMMEFFLKFIEETYGIHHLCVEFQFDFQQAKKQVSAVDELLRP